MKNKKGFTLTEMMVVVIIIATLASIAYPLYSRVIMKARVAEAISLGEIIRESQQRSLAINGRYFDAFNNSHISDRTRLIKGNDVTLSNGRLRKGLYTMSILNANGVDNGCIRIDYGQTENNTIFTIYMHVEDSKMWCIQTDGGTNICDAVAVDPAAPNMDCSK